MIVLSDSDTDSERAEIEVNKWIFLLLKRHHLNLYSQAVTTLPCITLLILIAYAKGEHFVFDNNVPFVEISDLIDNLYDSNCCAENA